MEIDAPLSANGVPVLNDMEWRVREREEVQIEIKIKGRSPLKAEGRLFLTTERLAFTNQSSSTFRSFSIMFSCIKSVNYRKLARRRKRITFESPEHGVSVDIFLLGSDLKTLIAFFFSMYHHNSANSIR